MIVNARNIQRFFLFILGVEELFTVAHGHQGDYRKSID
jgi:hypothetical protein